MNQEKFSALVNQLELYASKDPATYKIRVGLLAALGYIYLFAIVGLLLFLVYFVLAHVSINWLVIKIIWMPLVLAGIALKSLWVSFPEPDGLHLKYEDTPALFDLVKQVEHAVQSPRADHILLTDEFNAAVVQIPRLGVFGWQRNYLLIGLPLMQALSPEQFRAVLAHELGHLSGNHGRFAAWIYRVRLTWIQILKRLQQEKRHGAFIFESFIKWYAPFFNAYSFVLARAQEYEADARAVEFAGKEHAAKALINLEIKSRFLVEDFWPKFYKQADAQAEPPANVFTQFVSAMEHEIPTDTAHNWFVQALMTPTGYEDTHPSLMDRLTAIGYPATSVKDSEYRQLLLPTTEAAGQNAAQCYLGNIAESFPSTRDRWWTEQVGQTWRERHRYVQKAQKNVQRLTEKAQTESLTAKEQWELARGLTETQGYEAALPRMLELLNADANHIEANYAYGQILLNQKDEAGIKYIEKAIALNEDAVLPGCEVIPTCITI